MLDENNVPWFVAVDVCKALEIKNVTDTMKRLDDDEKATLDNTEGRAGNGAQGFNVINESGLYSLILTSRKAEAKRFKKWVTAEVLPAIRKMGSYQQSAQAEKPMALPDGTKKHVWMTLNSSGRVLEQIDITDSTMVGEQVDKYFPDVAVLNRKAVVADMDAIMGYAYELTAKLNNHMNGLITILGTPPNATQEDADRFWKKRVHEASGNLSRTADRAFGSAA
jgi:hypothetical protein